MMAYIDFLSSLEAVAALLSFVLTIVAGFLSAGVRFRERRELTEQDSRNLTDLTENIVESGAKGTKSKEQLREEHLTRRLGEVKAAIKRFERQASIYGFSNGLLIFGQYIIGAALASSFIQQSVSNNVIGILGIIVLLATTTHQKMRPDQRSKIATEKVGHLRSTIRRAQDELVKDSPALLETIRTLSDSLNQTDRYDEILIESQLQIASNTDRESNN